jgi:tellurite resistance protein TerC
MTYIFGAFLVYTAMKMLFSGDDEQFQPKNLLYIEVLKIMPISNHIDEEHFL